MGHERAREIARKVFEEAWNSGDPDLIAELYHPDFVGSVPQGRLAEGPDDVARFLLGFHQAVADLRFTVQEQIVEGERVATRWIGEGRHTGELYGQPPTGGPITVAGITIQELQGARVIRSWSTWEFVESAPKLRLVGPG